MAKDVIQHHKLRSKQAKSMYVKKSVEVVKSYIGLNREVALSNIEKIL